ncbi:hypothetical protein AT6N2_C1438 [Agrobacterium tumefaciens]|nr:hypothetical protein AT6N2_C1438 [Agrobacterium tumefaciens]
MTLMVLPAEEHSQNTHHFFRLINIEIEYRLMFCYPAKAGQHVGQQRPLEGRGTERLHVASIAVIRWTALSKASASSSPMSR